MKKSEITKIYKTDCFAFRMNKKIPKCDALNKLDCENCVFYKPQQEKN